MSLSRVKAEGTRLATNEGPVILRGVNVADPGQIADKRHESIEDVIQIATAPPVKDSEGRWTASKYEGGFGSNVVRLPVLPDAFFSGPEKYIETYLDPAIEGCIIANAYAIIDCHYIAESLNYIDLKPKIEQFWSWVAPRFATYENVIYEILNEPVKPRGWQQFRNTLAQPMVDLIREKADKTLILVGGTYYNNDVPFAVDNPIDDDNIAYVVHCYPEFYPVISDQLEPLIKEYPVFVTEWGYEQGIDSECKPGTHSPSTTKDFGEPWLNFMESNELSWTAWILDPLLELLEVNPP